MYNDQLGSIGLIAAGVASISPAFTSSMAFSILSTSQEKMNSVMKSEL